MKRNLIFSFRANEKEAAALQIMALDDGLSYSDFTRSLIRKEAERRGLPPLAYLENQAKEKGAINDR